MHIKMLLLLITLVLPMLTLSQDKDVIFTKTQTQAEFPGGEEKMLEFLAEHISYPRKAREEGIEGVVYAEFVVNRDGSLTKMKIVKDIDNGGYGFGEEVIKVLKLMPAWKPATVNGRNVRSFYTLPVMFQQFEEPKRKRKKRKKRKHK